ncbi:uncharacterized protein LY89DRAFT_785082 [Mollisia scopiformis]|uniref:C2H2-type domain-containing protein n=1 Tax=Mollisia scopiformis TaxID=149040 RepID=A0A194WZI3_MOLSC|nr:uncharacterized protein LY89DRAFT_785082 [Mollisia scopiformis]KUJ13361.1 hypothetical protein LY89DRAFT_785082 [Mollisia scopiformis]
MTSLDKTTAFTSTAISDSNSIRIAEGPQKPHRQYSCPICQKVFKRSEHCLRHVRGHTREKPFSCRFCGRRYSRKDLVSRHEKSFHPLGSLEHNINNSIDTNTGAHQNNVEEEGNSILPDVGYHTLSPGVDEEYDQRPDARFSQNTQNTDTSPDKSMEHITQDTQQPQSDTQEPRQSNIADETTQSSLPPHTETNSTAQDGYLGNSPTHAQLDLSDLRSPYRQSQLQDFAFPSSTSVPLGTAQQSHLSGSYLGDDGQVNANRPSSDQLDSIDFNAHSAYDNHLPNLPDGIDFFSMLPNGATNIDMDSAISNYLFNSGYSPTIDNDMARPLGDSNSSVTSQLAQDSHDLLLPSTDPTELRNAPGSFARLPTVIDQKPRNVNIPILDATAHFNIIADVRRRLSPEQFSQFQLPTAQKLQQYLTSYFTCFHHHLPILHLPSLDMRMPYVPLVLAVSAIGALYRLNRKVARLLWQWAEMMVEPALQRDPSDLMAPCLTEAVQSRLLLSLYAVFSGDTKDVVSAIERSGFWATEYRIRRCALNRDSLLTQPTSWLEWTTRETSKRLLCGIFTLNSLLTVTYDTTPNVSLTQDLNIEMPADEGWWEAKDAQQWQHAVDASDLHDRVTISKALTQLVYGDDADDDDGDVNPNRFTRASITWSGFATTVIMHAVGLHMWSIMQCSHSVTGITALSSPSWAPMYARIQYSLARCHALVVANAQRDQEPHSEKGAVIFNCQALLRIAYVRLFTSAGSVDRMMLLSQNDAQLESSIQSYMHAVQKRSPFLTKAVLEAFGGFSTPIKAGYLMVRKTAALSWSVEHAIAAWDCALFVTKWIHALETRHPDDDPLDPAEAQNFANFSELLNEVESDYDGKGSLAGEVARVWACFLDDTWVWAITPRMGHVLRLLSKAYIKEWNARAILA